MKKSLLALAVLGAFAGAASAQTSVTMYGSFDAGIRNVNNAGAAVGANSGDSKMTMGSNGTYNSNRIGFKGTEDLGGGMSAMFQLESGFNSGTGALDSATQFNRTAMVGLGGTWGTLGLGRQYSVNFKTIGLYDPFGYKYTGIIPLASQGGLSVTSSAGVATAYQPALTRLNNDIQYTGTFNGLTIRAEHALGEVVGSSSSGAATAVGLSYAMGPFTVAGAYTKRKSGLLTPANPSVYADQTNWTIGGSYKTADYGVSLGYADNKQEIGTGIPDASIKDIWVGGNFNVSPVVSLTAAYYRTKSDIQAPTYLTRVGRQNLFIIGATYALSKRTNFYADIDNKKYTGSVIPSNGETSQTGVSVGINHVF